MGTPMRGARRTELPGHAPNAALGKLVARCDAEIAGGLAPVEWAEDEIRLPIGRHPATVSDLRHSARRLVPRKSKFANSSTATRSAALRADVAPGSCVALAITVRAAEGWRWLAVGRTPATSVRACT
jgi:hypothetical protein